MQLTLHNTFWQEWGWALIQHGRFNGKVRLDSDIISEQSNYRKYTLKSYLLSYPNQNSISTNGKTIEYLHEPLLFFILYRLQESGKSLSLMVFH